MSGLLSRWRTLLVVLGALVIVVATRVEAQRSFSQARVAQPEDVDGRFQFCRIEFNAGGGFGSSWSVDWPRADINLSIRLSELTKTDISRTDGVPNHLLMRLTDPVLFQCPFIMMTEVGSASFSSREAESLRQYLLKGGFLWVDDFWGEGAWQWWAEEFEQVLPSKDYPIVDLDASHPLFRSQFVVKETPQIASINYWYRSGGDTSERGADSAVVHTRAVLDRHGNIMVLMTHNTDLGDSFEREGDDPSYFLTMSVPGYAFGINSLLYAMTH